MEGFLQPSILNSAPGSGKCRGADLWINIIIGVVMIFVWRNLQYNSIPLFSDKTYEPLGCSTLSKTIVQEIKNEVKLLDLKRFVLPFNVKSVHFTNRRQTH